MSATPFNAQIIEHWGKNSDSASFFIHEVGQEAVSRKVTDVDVIGRMNFASNPILGKTINFMDLRLSTVNTADKLNSVFTPNTRVEGLMDHSDWLSLGIVLRKLRRGK